MTTQIKEVAIGNTMARRYVEIQLSGKLDRDDYKKFVPVIENRIEEEGKVNLLVLFEDFHGWDAGALWEDIKFDVKHFNHIEKIALAGNKDWEKGMAKFCKPFTTAEVKYFKSHQTAEARLWLEQIQ
ncbi:MAG: STAS/SEC14 domain-containing protein [Verrucomicrobiales bacterium]|nr:STAS/SEC14 domain-containing protein [Verrucomicrobiales bacterium]